MQKFQDAYSGLDNVWMQRAGSCQFPGFASKNTCTYEPTSTIFSLTETSLTEICRKNLQQRAKWMPIATTPFLNQDLGFFYV